jgi:AmiR/NasT family two-component response regulator
MTRRPTHNFRGLRALLLVAAERDADSLERALARIGMAAARISIGAAGPERRVALRTALATSDLAIVDADTIEPELIEPIAARRLPTLVLIGHETPGRLVRAFELRPTAFLAKPVRSHGLFSAVFLAVNEHHRRSDLEGRLQAAEARASARRHVVKAILEVMRTSGLDDEEAYRRLRLESMRRRITVEDMAQEVLAAPAGPRRINSA